MSGNRFGNRTGTRNNPRATSSTICQKCLGTGHYIYDCKNTRPYASRPSRTKQLEKPEVYGRKRDKPSVEVPDEFKSRSERAVKKSTEGLADAILEAKEKERAAKKSKTKRSSSNSDSDSSSDSDSDSEDSSSGSSSSGSRSRSRTPSVDRDRELRRREKSSRKKRDSASPSPEPKARSSRRD